jgi:hypothetical protein
LRRELLRRIVRSAIAVFVIGAIAYLLFWPVPVAPVAWRAPPNPGDRAPFIPNDRLADLEMLPIGRNVGPEAVTTDSAGRIYVATREHIVRLQPDGTRPENWARTGGRPLGMAFDARGNLIVADAFRGLLSIAPTGAVSELATVADGIPIRYADDLDIAADGKIYFSDASTKFDPREHGTLQASVLEIVEHAGTGRLLVYDPATRQATTLLGRLHFANGVAIAHDQESVLVSETGAYRVLRVWLSGARRGTAETLIEGLPGFPDNITRGAAGRYWVALYAPRSRALDATAAYPFLRKVILRLPVGLRPEPRHLGHVLAIDDGGRVSADLQDPSGEYHATSSALETAEYLYVGSLVAGALGRLPKHRAGL